MMTNLQITSHDVSSCEDDGQVVGVGGVQDGPLTVLKFAYDKGSTKVLCFEDSSIRHLVAVLKSLLPSLSAIDALSVSVDVNTGAVRACSP